MILSLVFEKQLRLTDVAEKLGLRQVRPAKVVSVLYSEQVSNLRRTHHHGFYTLPLGNTASMDPVQGLHFCGSAHCRRNHVGDENVSPAQRRLP